MTWDDDDCDERDRLSDRSCALLLLVLIAYLVAMALTVTAAVKWVQ